MAPGAVLSTAIDVADCFHVCDVCHLVFTTVVAAREHFSCHGAMDGGDRWKFDGGSDDIDFEKSTRDAGNVLHVSDVNYFAVVGGFRCPFAMCRTLLATAGDFERHARSEFHAIDRFAVARLRFEFV